MQKYAPIFAVLPFRNILETKSQRRLSQLAPIFQDLKQKTALPSQARRPHTSINIKHTISFAESTSKAMLLSIHL